jgi:hypothetical protein
VSVPPGAAAAPNVYYRDTTAGTATLTASAPGRTSATQQVVVTGAAATALAIAPASATVAAHTTKAFTAAATDGYGNTVAVTPTWTIAPGTAGTLTADGSTATFTAAAPGTGTITASLGTLTATAAVTVVRTPLRVAALGTRFSSRRLVVTLTLVSRATGAPVAGARVALAVRRGRALAATLTGTTTRAGKVVLRTRSALARGCYSASVRAIGAAGYAWNGVAPTSRRCR